MYFPKATLIEDVAFLNCTSLTNISNAFPEVTKLGGNGTTNGSYGAFRGCTGLKSVVIPESVKKIGWNAFSECTGLTHLTIPSTVRIDAWAFDGCTALKEVEIKGEMKPFPERLIWEDED